MKTDENRENENIKRMRNRHGISVIIPVYNGEKYLKRCLDSIYQQDYRPFEIIIINDGSVDSSGSICDEYANRKEGVKTVVIHKQNEGLIKARREGLFCSHYDFTAFVDADDWIEKNHLSVMMQKIEQTKADLVIEDALLEIGEKTELRRNRFSTGEYDKHCIEEVIFPKMLCYEGFFSFGLLPYMWNKVFLRKKLLECYEELDQRVYDGEDVLAFFSYMMKTERMVIGKEHTYHYCLTPDSMTAKIRKDYYCNISRLYLSLHNVFSKSDRYACLLPQLEHYMRMMVLRNRPELMIESQKHIFPFVKVKKGSRIVLYGAGLVGKTYLHQMRMSGYCNLIAWVDKNFDNLEEFEGVKAQSPIRLAKLQSNEYDYVVIAIDSIRTWEEVRAYLVGQLCIPIEKVL